MMRGTVVRFVGVFFTILTISASALAVGPDDARRVVDRLVFLYEEAHRDPDALVALYQRGDWEKCRSLGDELVRTSKGSSVDMLNASFCSVGLADWKKANTLLAEAASTKRLGSEGHDRALVILSGNLLRAMSAAGAKMASEVIRRSKRWSREADANRALGTIEWSRLGTSRRISLKEAFATETEWLNAGDRELGEEATQMRLERLMRSGSARDRVNFILATLEKFNDPVELGKQAYKAFYQIDNLEGAFIVYQAQLPYLHVWSTLPHEDNTMSYSEIETGLCRDSLLQGPDQVWFKDLKFRWSQGKVTALSARDELIAKNAVIGEKADLLTMLASIELMTGKTEAATALFWRAHQICPYYNRAHWGLSVIYRRLELAATREKVSLPLASLSDPARIFVNWATLTAEAQAGVLSALGIWTAWIEEWTKSAQSKNSNRFVYIKSPFELLSDVPGLAHLRDKRIEGGGYDDDHRLWDDVRGSGGKQTTADIAEVMLLVDGESALLAHELAHFFHNQWSELASQNDRDAKRTVGCITRLYNEAKARRSFVDNYSATNEFEYFAQAAMHLSAAGGDAVAKLKTIDPKLASFFASLISSNGRLSGIRCQ